MREVIERRLKRKVTFQHIFHIQTFALGLIRGGRIGDRRKVCIIIWPNHRHVPVVLGGSHRYSHSSLSQD
jgi:hypothetical protein